MNERRDRANRLSLGLFIALLALNLTPIKDILKAASRFAISKQRLPDRQIIKSIIETMSTIFKVDLRINNG